MTTYLEKVENYIFNKSQDSLIKIGFKPIFHKIIVPNELLSLPNGLRPPPLLRNNCLTVNIVIYVDENDIVIEDSVIDDIYINNHYIEDDNVVDNK